MPGHPLVLVEVLLLPLTVGHLLTDHLGLGSTLAIGARLSTGIPGTITPDREVVAC